MSPVEVLGDLIYRGLYGMCKKIPGEVVSKSSKEQREILAELKSSDIKNVRADHLFDKNFEKKKNVSNMLIDFDKKIR